MKPEYLPEKSAYLGLLIAISLSVSGCGWKETAEIEQQPRPVEVATLSKNNADLGRRLIKGAVNSWRTETVAMEVGGRLTYLADDNTIFEPATDKPPETVNELPSLAPRTSSGRSDLLIAGIDDEKYRILRDKAEVTKLKTQASIKAAEVDLKQLLPAKQRAAEAELSLAERDYTTAKKLFDQDAFPEAELNRLEAVKLNAQASKDQAEAALAAQEANVAALKSQLLGDNKNLEDAERNLNNCNLLFNSFRGELTKTDVEMGDLVQPNQVIGTVQMMDPIMIEFEASSYDSRRLAKMEKLRVIVDGDNKNGDEEAEPLFAKVYEIDSVADPSSRTFTVTLLMFNQRAGENVKVESELLVTDGVLPLEFSLFGEDSDELMHAPEQCIFTDSKGSYVLRVDNVKKGGSLPDEKVLEVSPVYVTVSPRRKLFYGDSYFREIESVADTPDELKLDRHRDMITGPMVLPPGASPEKWDWSKNNRVKLKNNRQWLLRPGELVDVDISSREEAGEEFSIPIDAISPEGDLYFVFLLAGDGESVEKKEVELVRSGTPQEKRETSSYMKIRPTNGENWEGRKYVRRGAHYLIDGEAVRVVPGGESR